MAHLEVGGDIRNELGLETNVEGCNRVINDAYKACLVKAVTLQTECPSGREPS